MKKNFIFLFAVILMLSGCGNAAAPQNEGEVTVSKEMLMSEEESEEQGSEKTEIAKKSQNHPNRQKKASRRKRVQRHPFQKQKVLKKALRKVQGKR